ncbi:MAG: sulfite exporter TauE/SafE family protein [Proteobacteria bacterium]|nr:sulfite exporter TauE/SafE family protein [Pseudomonadota bacterium]
MDSAEILLYSLLVLFLGGLFKGVAGLGLPLIGMPLLTLAVDLKTAVAILVMPLVASNLFQSFQGGLFAPIFRRFWPLLLSLFVVGVVSTKALVILPEQVLFAIIGIALIIVPTIAHFRPDLRVVPGQEHWLGPLVGAAAGFMGGISSFYGPILLLYVVWLRLPKNEFVVAISQMFSIGAIGLALGLFAFGITKPVQFGISTIVCVPVFAGLWLGQKVRFRMSERGFARLILITYIVSGATFLLKLV